MADWIPGISQLKSGFQLICGDVKGAARTQENFVRQCPVVSQVTSLVQLAAGDEDGALETQKQCGRTISNFADGIPAIGHVKGAVHYIAGDQEGGDKAMRSATRTTAVMGAGAGGFLVGGPVGAAAAGIGAGTAMDTIYTVATDKSQGFIAAVEHVVENPSAGAFFDAALMPVGDAMTGMAGGNIAKNVQNTIQLKKVDQLYSKADATLQAAESNKGSLTSAEYLQQCNEAGDLFKTAQNIEAKVNGPPPATDLGMGKGKGTAGQNAGQSTSTTSSSGAQAVVPESATITKEEQRSRSSQRKEQSKSPHRREESKSREREKVKWWWNRAENPWAGRPIWLPYEPCENTKIETARSNGWPEVELDGGDDPNFIRVVNFRYEIQYQRDDVNRKQTQVRRVEGDRRPDNNQMKKKPADIPEMMDTYSRTKQEAMNKAKDANGISREKRAECYYEVDDRNNRGLKCAVHEFKNIRNETIQFRRDNPVTYSNGMKQRAHFNVAVNGVDSGQHHYYGSL